jgi:pimeloyl-ACP methyl ester carboxylesterase
MAEYEIKSLSDAAGAPVYRHWPGKRPAVVLIHGLASNGTRWSELARRLSAEDGWMVLAPDLRGHGRSISRDKLHADVWVQDIARMLDREGVDRAEIGGHCLGANLAVRFACRFPGRTAGLILVEPMLPDALSGGFALLSRIRGLLLALAGLARLLNRCGIRRRKFPELDLEQLDRITRARIANTGDQSALTRRYGAALPDLRYLPVSAYLSALYETVRPLPPLGELGVPVLAVLSSGARFGDPDAVRASLSGLPQVRITTVRAVHWIPTEQPEALYRAISSWLGAGTREGQD